MFGKIVEKILKSIDDKPDISGMRPKFSGDGYRAHKIDAVNFHPIKKSDSCRKIAFVDGGNAQILGSGNFSLSLIKACYVVYENNKKIKSERIEIFAFAESIVENNEISYKISFFKSNDTIDLNDICFGSFDPTLMTGSSRADIKSVANAARRFAELRIAKYVSDRKIADVIVLDGNLQCTYTGENIFLENLYASCEKNHVLLCGICKTTSIFTDNGNLVGVVLMNLNKDSWLYHPVVDIENKNHRAEMAFVKLHDKSRHAFRFEILKNQRAEMNESVNLISSNCRDPVFIGYPYGLIEADRIARVSNQERDSLRTIFLVKMKNKNIEKHLNSGNAHEILDRISF